MELVPASHNAENKPMHYTRADRTRELAEWGGVCAGNDGHCRTQSDWAVLAIGGTAGAVQSTPLIPWCDQCLA